MRRPLTSSIVVMLALGSGCTEHKPAAEPKPAVDPPVTVEPAVSCELRGTYRFRFASNGHEGWWFRLQVNEQAASLLEPVSVLGLDAGPIEVTRNLEACQLIVRAEGEAVGELVVTLTLDSASRISGELTRTKAHIEADKHRGVKGVRDPGPQTSDAACVVPGIYEVTLDPKATWAHADQPSDDQPCDDAGEWAPPIYLRIEPYADTLAVTLREPEPPYAEGWATDELTRHGDCDVSVRVVDDIQSFSARLELAGDTLKGVADRVSYQIAEDGPEGGGFWDCVAHDVSLTATRLP
jgi:hypothetical protein